MTQQVLVRQRKLLDGRLRVIVSSGAERASVTGAPDFVRTALEPVLRGWGASLELDDTAATALVVIPGQEQLDDVGEAPPNGSRPVSTFD